MSSGAEVEDNLKTINGIEYIDVDIDEGYVTLRFDKTITSVENISASLGEIGYKVKEVIIK